MKKLLFYLPMIILTGILFTACKKDNSTAHVTAPIQYMTATTDGVPFTANRMGAGLDSKGCNCFIIDGQDSTILKSIFLQTPSNIKDTGTYYLGSGGSYATYNNNTPTNVSASYSGKIVITKLDTIAKVIQGSFSFLATRNSFSAPILDSNVITNGAFSANY